MEKMCHFYVKLYTRKSIENDNINGYSNDVECPKFEKEYYNSLHTINECADAVHFCK